MKLAHRLRAFDRFGECRELKMLEMQLVTRAWKKNSGNMKEGFSRRWKELRINIRDLSLWLHLVVSTDWRARRTTRLDLTHC
jgi:hypothetical protein